MAPKQKKKSRLITSEDTKFKTECHLPEPDNYDLLKANEKSLSDAEVLLCETEAGEEMELEESSHELKMALSRTCMLLREYFEFKAARCIQRFVRGWLYRTKYRRQRLAAIKIQSEWRRFYCQRMYFRQYEMFLQQQILQHFQQAAQKIQALWRGWWVRHHIHDHTRLMYLQLLSGEDLLYCVAFKLHHLLRTHQIPGVYSLRDSSALSKVEQLLASLKFKTYNPCTVQAVQKSLHDLKEARRQHKKSAYGTKVPFAGPSLNNPNEIKYPPPNNVKQADLIMSKILQMYEESNRKISMRPVLKKKLSRSKHTPTIAASPAPLAKSSSFCSDVVNSMKKWKIITENNFHVDANVFKKPQNVENFLKEIQSQMSLVQGNCYCGQEFVEVLSERNTKGLSNEKVFSVKQRFPTTTQHGSKFPITCDGVKNTCLYKLPADSCKTSGRDFREQSSATTCEE